IRDLAPLSRSQDNSEFPRGFLGALSHRHPEQTIDHRSRQEQRLNVTNYSSITRVSDACAHSLSVAWQRGIRSKSAPVRRHGRRADDSKKEIAFRPPDARIIVGASGHRNGKVELWCKEQTLSTIAHGNGITQAAAAFGELVSPPKVAVVTCRCALARAHIQSK